MPNRISRAHVWGFDGDGFGQVTRPRTVNRAALETPPRSAGRRSRLAMLVSWTRRRLETRRRPTPVRRPGGARGHVALQDMVVDEDHEQSLAAY